MLKNYIKLAWKVLGRHRLFTFISLFGISFTLLILVVIASFINHFAGPGYPEKNMDHTLSVVMLILRSESGGMAGGPMISPWLLNNTVNRMQTPDKISIASFHKGVVTYRGKRKFNFNQKYVDGPFWEIMDFDFIEGGPFTQDQVSSVLPVAVINAETRDEYFDGENAVGQTLKLKDRSFRVVGVVKNVSMLRIMPYADIWIPSSFSTEDVTKPTLMGTMPGWYATLMSKDRTGLQAIRQEFDQILAQMEDPGGHWDQIITGAFTYPENLNLLFFRSEGGGSGPLLRLAFILITVFLLLPTVNLVNINLSRIWERSSEIGVRKAFGASSTTLIGQFVTENIIITLLGGLISFVLAVIVLELINNSGLLPHLALSFNWQIFITGIWIALFFGVLSGVYPAWKMSRLHPVEALRGAK